MASPLDIGFGARAPSGDGALLQVNPFLSLSYHFGMLLGVEDLEIEQAYHRGKTRLHNAWLHGEGVVWGYGVTVARDAAKGELEIQVFPGLALDAAGRELHLDTKACVGLGAWLEKHKDDPELLAALTPVDLPDTKVFVAHVVARFRACLSRPVPALAEPCAGAGSETAYSRVFETVELLLRPGKAPKRTIRYGRLRLLFGLDEAGTDNGLDKGAVDDVLAARNAILALPAAKRAPECLAAFRRFAALDTINLSPAVVDGERASFPASDDTFVVLAEIRGIRVKGGKLVEVDKDQVDETVRPSHVATSTIQELCAGFFLAAQELDAGGPRVENVKVNPGTGTKPATVTMQFTGEILAATQHQEAFVVSELGASWEPVGVVDIDPGTSPSTTLILTLAHSLTGSHVRVIARGTGHSPLLDTKFIPLAGAVGGPPGSKHDGHDFVGIYPLTSP